MGDGIRVDPDGLDDFSAAVNDNVPRNIEAGYYENRGPLEPVKFGISNAGGGIHAAKARYMESYQASMANIQAYIEAARILASAASSIAAEFRQTDAMSADRVSRVDSALSNAIQQSREARRAAENVPLSADAYQRNQDYSVDGRA